ncbi:MAG: hypothetical protein IAF38_20055 [Bacteroidia bacterium]|nr:hypothetical protein [Bacteroidia bacterium]
MRILLKEQITLEQLKDRIAQQFPDCQLSFRTKNLLIVKKSKTAAAMVMVGKQKVTVNEGFPSVGGQLVFVACILLLGILIPMIVYFSAFFPAQKKIRNEVADFVKQEYGQASTGSA